MKYSAEDSLRYFNKHVVKGKRKDDCWGWTGCKNVLSKKGIITYNARQIYAHRYSYIIHIGPIKPGNVVMHTCDVETCLNPRHLVQGTQYENIMDMVAKKRQHHPRGEINPKAVLTPEDVRYIRKVWIAGSKGKFSSGNLGKQFGICADQIRIVATGKAWKHVD